MLDSILLIGSVSLSEKRVAKEYLDCWFKRVTISLFDCGVMMSFESYDPTWSRLYQSMGNDVNYSETCSNLNTFINFNGCALLSSFFFLLSSLNSVANVIGKRAESSNIISRKTKNVPQNQINGALFRQKLLEQKGASSALISPLQELS